MRPAQCTSLCRKASSILSFYLRYQSFVDNVIKFSSMEKENLNNIKEEWLLLQTRHLRGFHAIFLSGAILSFI